METSETPSHNLLSFNLINDTNKAKIYLTLQNKKSELILSAKDDSSSDSKEYITSFNLYSLYKLHRFFKIFETMDEVIESLSQLIENKGTKIYSNGKGELILELNLIIGIKNELIKINFHKKNNNLEETVFKLTKKN